mgnify:CR=1 FL=1
MGKKIAEEVLRENGFNIIRNVNSIRVHDIQDFSEHHPKAYFDRKDG